MSTKHPNYFDWYKNGRERNGQGQKNDRKDKIRQEITEKVEKLQIYRMFGKRSTWSRRHFYRSDPKFYSKIESKETR